MTSIETRIPPPLITGIAVLAIVLMWWFAPQFQLAFPWLLAKVIGGVLILAGLVLAINAVGLFRRTDTTILPFEPGKTTALVTSGIYRFTRNPMYLGMAMIVLGAAFVTRQPLGVVAVIAVWAFLTRFQIIPEERALEQTFGQEFTDYKRRVRRWI